MDHTNAIVPPELTAPLAPVGKICLTAYTLISSVSCDREGPLPAYFGEWMQHFGDPDSPSPTRLGRLLQHMRESKVRFHVSNWNPPKEHGSPLASVGLGSILFFIAFPSPIIMEASQRKIRFSRSRVVYAPIL